MLRAARARAKKQGVPYRLTPEDIVIPLYCPVLGTKLAQSLGSKGPGDNSPSLDRVVPARGYVPGNVVVLSNRANRAKSDLSIDELEALVSFYRSREQK